MTDDQASDLSGPTAGRVVLTPTQTAIWAAQRLNDDVPLANMAKRIRIRGRLDPRRFVTAFDAVVRHCEILRMQIGARPGSTGVRIVGEPPSRTTVVELPFEDVGAWTADRIAVPVDASRCVYDSVLIRHADDDWTWWLDLHHVATDAWASMLVYDATSAAYAQLDDPTAVVDLDGVVDAAFFGPVSTLPVRRSGGDSPEDRRAGWRHDIESVGPPTPLEPYGRRRGRTTAVDRVDLPLAADVAAALDDALATSYRSISRELALLTIGAMATAIVLHRLDGRRSVLVGVPVHHRSSKATRRLVGPVMETYPLPVTVVDGDTHEEMFARVLASVTTLLRRARPGERPEVQPEVLVNVVTARYGDFAGHRTDVSWIRSDHASPEQTIGLQLFDYGPPDGNRGSRDLTWELEVNGSIGDPDVAVRFPDHLAAVVDAVVRSPGDAVASTPLVTPAERAELARLSPEPEPAPPGPPVHEVIRGRLRAAPDRIVAEHRGRTISAASFDDRADRLAGWLIASGVTAGSAVGIRMERSIDVLVAIHGVLRAGAAFVMLDPDDPSARHDFVVADADISVVLDELPAAAVLDDVVVDELPAVAAADLAYVLYTSGSTGVPKGVPISHEGLADYLRLALDTYVGDRAPVVPLHSALVFDLTITSIFLAMLADGLTVIVDGDPVVALGQVAADDRIDFLKATPSQLELYIRMVSARRPLATVVVGGEAFRRPVAERLAACCTPELRIFNEYGPTEAVVGCMIHEWSPELDTGVDVPIGRACDGAEVRILDPAGQLTPVGAWGELVVRRPGMASGYLNRPELTDGLFVRIDDDGLPGPRSDRPWYRTGDRARIERPGVVAFGGRSDDQVKVAGIRLEPAEVEAALVGIGGIESALVRLWSPPHDPSDRSDEESASGILTAWYVAADGRARDPGELRRALRERVPVHALPLAYVPIPAMPLAASAKADPRLLPPPQAVHRVSVGSVPAATDSERLLAEIWSLVLGVDGVGATDDFFDLGGASLQALEVVAAVHVRTGVDLADAAVFEAPTVRELASVLDTDSSATARAAADTARPTIDVDDPPPLSAGEEAMLFEHRTARQNGLYNVARVYRLTERSGTSPIDLERLRAAFGDLVGLHAPLHTAFDPPRTRLAVDAALSFVEREPLSPPAFATLVDSTRSIPFDLEAGPLVRVIVSRTGPSEVSLMLSMHHISADAETLALLWRQLAERYAGSDLPDLDTTYSAYCSEVAAESTAESRRFWLAKSRDAVPRIAVESPSTPTADGYASTVVDIGADRLGRVGPTPFSEGMAIAAVAFAGLTGRADVEFGISSSTKRHARAAPLVGYFLNTLPVRVDVGTPSTFAELVATTAGLLEELRPHRSYPFAEIVRDARREGLVPPDASLMFAFDRVATPHFDGADVDERIVPSGVAVADATLFMFVHDDHTEIGLEYRGTVLDAARADGIVAGVAQLLGEAIADPARPIDDLTRPLSEPDLVGPEPPESGIVLERFVDHVSARPGAIAVVGADEATTSYASLADAVVRTANQLTVSSGGDLPARRVGVVARRDVDVVVGMLAAQFAGAAYVPIDPAVPAERRNSLLAAAGVAVVLVGAGVDDSFPDDLPAMAIATPTPGPTGNEADHVDPEPAVALRSMLATIEPDDVAYTIFTSGSTGPPRAVEVSHANLGASTAARDRWYPAPPRRFLVTSSIGFDSSMVGLVWPLATGGTVVLPGDDVVHDVDRILTLIDRLSVSHVLMVPSLYRGVLDRHRGGLASLEIAVVAGEACPPALVTEHARRVPEAWLVNEYGPTETTVWATADVLYRPEEPTAPIGDGPVSIGGPVPGATLRIGDERLRPVWAGVAGELLIAGSGVTGGYRGDPEATADRFAAADGTRWYRSGDRVRCRGGRLYFLGRLDDQLNVGGVRVEPAEIESAARTVPGVTDAAVVAAGEPPALVLAVEGSTAQVDLATVRAHLERALPAALVPRRSFVVDALPRTARGKLDRSAIGELDQAHRRAASPRSVGETGERGDGLDVGPVVRIWREVLDAPDADGESDFFELGGDSLLAVQLVSALEVELDRTVPIAAVLTGRTPDGVSFALGLGGPGKVTEPVDPIVVTQLAPGAPGGPLVVMTASWDDIFGYQALARALPADVRVVAVGYDDSAATELDGVEEYVAACVGRCAELVDGQPLALIGWSAGGLVALELARQLRARGVDVAVVGLIDTYFPGEEQHLWSNRWWKYKSLLRPSALRPLAQEMRTTLTRRSRAATVSVRRRLGGDPDGAPEAIPVGRSARFPDDVFAYEPQPSAEPVVLYRASTTNPARTIERWRTVARRLDDVVVQGRHRGFESIMGADRVDAIADDIAARLRAD